MNKFHINHISICLLPHQSAEGHDRGDASEEEEDGGRHALDMQAISEVTQIELVSVFYILHQPTKHPETTINPYTVQL